MQDLKVNIDGKEYSVKVEELDSGKLKVYFNGETFEVETKSDIEKGLFEETEEKKGGKEKGVIVQNGKLVQIGKIKKARRVPQEKGEYQLSCL